MYREREMRMGDGGTNSWKTERLAECDRKPHRITGPFHRYMHEKQGYGCIKFEISNSTISTVFHQPLRNSLHAFGRESHAAIQQGSLRSGIRPAFSASCCPANQRQKLLSRHWFCVFHADVPKGLLLRRSVFSQTPAFSPDTPARKHQLSTVQPRLSEDFLGLGTWGCPRDRMRIPLLETELLSSDLQPPNVGCRLCRCLKKSADPEKRTPGKMGFRSAEAGVRWSLPLSGSEGRGWRADLQWPHECWPHLSLSEPGAGPATQPALRPVPRPALAPLTLFVVRRFHTGVCEKTVLFCELLPCNPAAETAFRPLILCFSSKCSQGSPYPEEWFFQTTVGTPTPRSWSLSLTCPSRPLALSSEMQNLYIISVSWGWPSHEDIGAGTLQGARLYVGRDMQECGPLWRDMPGCVGTAMHIFN